MTTRETKALDRALFKLVQRLELRRKTSMRAQKYHAALESAWRQVYEDRKQDELSAARAKDGNVVLWTVFQPRGYFGMCEWMRTALRNIRRWPNQPDMDTEAVQLEWITPAEDFARAMGHEGRAA